MTQKQSSPQFDQEFPVEWLEPGDEKLRWVRDVEHFPNPLTPLSVNLTQRVFAEIGFRQLMAQLRGLPTAEHTRTFYPQGFVYHLAAQP